MWMMGYNDHGGELNLHDSSFNGTTRRLRPLIPRPLPSSTTLNSPSSNPPCFFAQYQQHLGNLGEQSKREFINSTSSNNNAATTAQVVVSSRWNPTPEQLRALEELYRRGTRTPSAEQIQHITAQLRRYGKIEGKNVFYWFQNHKARERQKRRRQMESGAAGGIDAATQRNEELGSSRTVYEVNQTKNWPPSSNCSTTLAEEFLVSIPRAVSENNNNNNNYKVAAESSAMQARTDGRTQLGEMELHNRWNINNNKMNGFVDRNATWQMMQLSCPSPHHLTDLINTRTSTTTSSTITTTTTTNNTTDHINITNNTTKTASTMDQSRLIKSSNITQQEHPSSFITPRYNRSGHIHHQNGLVINSCDSSQIIEDHQHDDDDDDDYIHDNICTSSEESQTLQLFPLRSRGDFLSDKEAVSGTNASTPCQFFEFLPLKN